jgi:hypothetical protein
MSNSSTPPPETIAYAIRDPHDVDASHLSALSICHFIWGGLLALFSCFGILYIVIGVMFVTGRIPQPPSSPPSPVDERFIGFVFIVGGAFAVVLGWLLAGCTIASGFYLRRRKRRMWSIIVAAFNCAIFPFGTTLGVFTLMVLLRDSVRRSYEERLSTQQR